MARWDRNFVFYLIYNCELLSGRDIDHIQPRSLLEGRDIPPDKIHSVANFQLLTIEKNRGVKNAKELKIWIKSMNDDYFTFHLIPERSSIVVIEKF